MTGADYLMAMADDARQSNSQDLWIGVSGDLLIAS
jgi:hypothetical protein